MILQQEIDEQQVIEATHNLNTLTHHEKKQHNEQVRNEIRETLSHKHKARALYRKLDIELLLWTQETITEVINLKQNEAQIQKEKQENRQNVIEQLKAVLADNNTTAAELFGEDDILETLTKKKRTQKVHRPPQYTLQVQMAYL